MEGHLPPAAQEKYEEMQSYQDEAEAVVEEKQQLERRLDDVETALDTLASIDEEKTVYRTVATLRVSADHEETRTDLEGAVEDLEDRIESLEERKAHLQEQFENCKQDIRHLLGGSTGSDGPGTASR